MGKDCKEEKGQLQEDDDRRKKLNEGRSQVWDEFRHAKVVTVTK